MGNDTLRLATAADAQAIADIYEPVVRDTFISFETQPPDTSEMRRRIEYTLPEFPWLVREIDGRVAGYAYASRHRERLAYRWSVDVSCYTHADYRRRGVGAALYRKLLVILRRQGFVNAYAGIALPNAASVALHEAVGFKAIGVYPNVGYKQGAWRDVGWWGREIGPRSAIPEDPVPLARLRPGILDDL
jgi:phosphinothricin acetyltransferase